MQGQLTSRNRGHDRVDLQVNYADRSEKKCQGLYRRPDPPRNRRPSVQGWLGWLAGQPKGQEAIGKLPRISHPRSAAESELDHGEPPLARSERPWQGAQPDASRYVSSQVGARGTTRHLRRIRRWLCGFGRHTWKVDPEYDLHTEPLGFSVTISTRWCSRCGVRELYDEPFELDSGRSELPRG